MKGRGGRAGGQRHAAALKGRGNRAEDQGREVWGGRDMGTEGQRQQHWRAESRGLKGTGSSTAGQRQEG